MCRDLVIQAHAFKFNSIHFCRTTSPLSTEATGRAANSTQTYQFWASVCSALCGFVNNPQNGNALGLFVPALKTLMLLTMQATNFVLLLFFSIFFLVLQTRLSVFVWRPLPQ